MITLSKAVQEAIAAGLPGMVANELKDFIVKAEKDAVALQRLTEQLTDRERTITELRGQLEKHRSLEEREVEIAKSAAANQEKELTLLKREAFIEAKIAQAELSGVKDTMTQFLRNTTVRQTVIADVSKPVDGMAPSSGNGYNSPGIPGMLQRNHDGKPDTTTTERTEE